MNHTKKMLEITGSLIYPITVGESAFIHGSSNCFDFDSRGREIPEKHWSVLNYTRRDSQIFTAEEMQYIAEVYEAASMNNRGGTRKSRNRSFEEGEFGRWIQAFFSKCAFQIECVHNGGTEV